MNVAAPVVNQRSMSRRLAVVIGLITLIVFLATGWAAVSETAAERNLQATDRLVGVARASDRELSLRIQSADSLLQYWSVADPGPDGAELRQRVLASDAFRGVVLMPWTQDAQQQITDHNSGIELPEFSPNERLTLVAGQSLLKVVAPDEAHVAIYLIHIINIAGSSVIALFEISPGWLWQDLDAVPAAFAIAVVDREARVVLKGTELPSALYRLFAAVDGRDRHRTVLHDWQQGGANWRAAVVQLELRGSRVAGLPWNIVAYGRVADLRPAWVMFATMIWPLLLLLALMIYLATRYLSRGWGAALLDLNASLIGLRHGQFQRVEVGGALDTPRVLIDSYNLALQSLQQRVDAQQRLAEFDRLLLEADDLEQSLEPILVRVTSLTGAQFAAVALIDHHAPGHARSFVTGAEGGNCPVSRINFDAEVTQSLEDQPHGFAVQPQQLLRYSFLEQLHALGARRFHVWPVMVGNHIAAILSVGYSGEALTSEEGLHYGANCALRLQLALSNQARDERLYRQAHFDSLTSLPNRLLFRDRLSQELASNTDRSQRGALLYIDLDHFKKINDTVGHIAGDQLLTIVAQRLRSCVKDGDTVARLGGDEFTVILRNIQSAEAAEEIAQRIIESLQRPVNIAGRDHQVRASIGITLYPDDGNTIEGLLRNADLAMYQAKESGRACAVFFDSKMTRAQLPLAESGLFRALRRREFSLYYQPQYAIHNGELVGLEALLRWHTARDGLRYPKDFVAAAEQSGLIVEIGAWALETACHQLALWREAGVAPARLALNVSAQQLKVGDFARLVRQTLERCELAPHMLELEVTENVFAEEAARQSLRQLASLGVRLALDDFGTGYSSLSSLRQHPVHTIKIDRSFMQEVPEQPQASTLAATIIDMAHALGKQVVAEGIETLAQLDFLREHGCDVAQGFVLARPLSVIDVSELLSQRAASELLQQRTAG